MKSKFADVVQEAQRELVEQAGGTAQINPDEVEGIMRWAAQGDPNTFKQFETMKGDQYVGSMVDAYRAQQQPAQGGQPQPDQQQAQPAAQPAAAPQQQATQQAQPAVDPNQAV